MPDAIEIEEISKLKIQWNYIFNTVIFKFWFLVLPFETHWCWWRILEPKIRDLNSVTSLCYLSQILSHHWWLTNICTGKNICKLTSTFWNKKMRILHGFEAFRLLTEFSTKLPATLSYLLFFYPRSSVRLINLRGFCILKLLWTG